MNHMCSYTYDSYLVISRVSTFKDRLWSEQKNWSKMLKILKYSTAQPGSFRGTLKEFLTNNYA